MRRFSRLLIAFAILLLGMVVVPYIGFSSEQFTWHLFANVYVTGDLAYVTLSSSDLVALVDTANHTVLGSINVGATGCDWPWRATMSPDGAYVYVACRYSNNVAVIETTGNTVVTTVDSIPSADGIAFTRDGAYALVGSRHSSQIAVVDTATHFATTISAPSNVRSVAAHPYLDVAYATSGDDNVLVIDTTTFSIVATIPVGDDPWDVAVSPDGQWVFAGSRWGDGLAVIDASNNTVHTTVTGLGELTGLDVAPDGSMVYASGLWNGVHVIDGMTLNHTATITDVGKAWEIAVTCDGSELYVGNTDNQVPAVTVMGTPWMVDQIGMPGSGARGIAICPQHVATGVFISPPEQTNPGGPGQVVAHESRLINATGASDSFSLTLGSHIWDTSLSTDSLGPVAHSDSVAFTVYVTVPVGVDWYLTDTVVVIATSVASPTVYSDTATFTTQVYAPPEISFSPDVLSSTQYVNKVVTQTLAINNGNGVTLTFNLEDTKRTTELVRVAPLNLSRAANVSGNRSTSPNGDHPSSAPEPLAESSVLSALADGVNPSAQIQVGRYYITTEDNEDNAHTGNPDDDVDTYVCGEDGNEPIEFNIFVDDVAGLTGNVLTVLAYDVDYPVEVDEVRLNGVYLGDLVGDDDIWSETVFDVPAGVVTPGPNLVEIDIISSGWCVAVDWGRLFVAVTPVPWLDETPISGSIPSDSSQDITVTFDATSVQPGEHLAYILASSNDPATPLLNIPVTMTVLPTANMGWVEGTVTDVKTGDPLEATIVALGQPYTVTTNPDTGYYKLWLDEGSHTVRAAAAGYVTETALVNITAQQGITRDFALVLNVPVLEVTPESLQVAQPVGEIAARTLTITNNGPAPLTFELREFDIGFSPTTIYASLLAILADTTSPTELDQRFAPTTAYVTLSSNDLVALVDTTTHTEIGTVNVGIAGCDHPWQAAMSPDRDYVYVGCRDSGNVAVIETASNTVVTTVGGIHGADGIAFTRDGAYALVGSRWSSQVAVVDTATHSVTNYIYTPSNARSVATHPYMDIAYATSTDGTIQVIDTTTFSITASISVGNDPHDVAVSPDGQWVFAGSRWGDGLAVVDADSNTLYTTVTGLGNLAGLEVALDGSAVYACGLWNGVRVIDGLTFNHITTVPSVGETWEAAVTCDGSELYVGNKGNQVPVIDTATFSVTEQISLSSSDAHGIAICPQHVARDVPWLSEEPITGTVPGYSSAPVQVTFDASSLQPGIHSAEIIVRSNDPVTPTASVPVTMTVEPTADMGRITGAVSDAWTGQPLTATVELVGVYSMTASPDYTVWAPAGTYSLTAYAPRYFTTTQSVNITAGGLVTANLALEPAQPRLEWARDAVSATVGAGYVANRTLMISNTGPLPLDIALYEISPNVALRAMSMLSPADLTGKRILYDRAHGEPDSSEYSSLINDVISAGAVITENWYTTDAALLEGYDVLWVNCCGGTAWGGGGELIALNNWLNEGGAVFVQGESSNATNGLISILFGITYQSGSCSSGTTTNIAEHPISEGVDAVYVDWTCWRLAPTIGADIVVFDTQGQPHVVAQEQNGGKMVVVASEDFRDGYIDYDDNRLLANNILAWLARPSYSDVPWLSETPQVSTIPGHSSLPVTLAFDATSLSLGDYQATLAVEHNDPAQPSPVEVPVTLSVVVHQAALSLVPALQERSGVPGEMVVHTFTATNTGNANDTFSLDAGGVWTPTLSVDTTGLLGVQESFVFTLGVTIPSTATYGISDTTMITARSTLDAGVSESVQAVTTVLSPHKIYLPLVLRSYVTS